MCEANWKRPRVSLFVFVVDSPGPGSWPNGSKFHCETKTFSGALLLVVTAPDEHILKCLFLKRHVDALGCELYIMRDQNLPAYESPQKSGISAARSAFKRFGTPVLAGVWERIIILAAGVRDCCLYSSGIALNIQIWAGALEIMVQVITSKAHCTDGISISLLHISN